MEMILSVERSGAGRNDIGFLLHHRVAHEVRRRIALLFQDLKVAIELFAQNLDQRGLRLSNGGENGQQKVTHCPLRIARIRV